MPIRSYILRGHEAVPARNLAESGAFFNDIEGRTVQKTKLIDPETQEEVGVSTVFLGLDYNFSNSGPPLVFETIVFGGRLADSMNRYATWDEAEAGHQEMVTLVGDSFLGKKPEPPKKPTPHVRQTWHDAIMSDDNKFD